MLNSWFLFKIMIRQLKPVLYILLTALLFLALGMAFRFFHQPILSVLTLWLVVPVVLVAVLFTIVTIIQYFIRK